MKNIADFIGHFKNIQDPKDDKVIIKNIIKNICNFDIEIANIQFKNSALKLNISGPEKTSIFMKQNLLLEQFKKEVLDRNITKIY